jgi:hypothetical protein
MGCDRARLSRTAFLHLIHGLVCSMSLLLRAQSLDWRVETIFRVHKSGADSAPIQRVAAAPHKHEATDCGTEAQYTHTPLSAPAHRSPRERCCSAWTESISPVHQRVATEVGWHSALTRAQEGRRKTTRTQQQRGAATCACAHPPRQPCAQGSTLPESGSSSAAENTQEGVATNSATLRQGGARSQAEKRQEEDSRGE